MPSLPFAAEAGQNSDYAIWRAGGRAKPAHRPIQAHELGERLLQAAGLRKNLQTPRAPHAPPPA
jgi:hypothetical protein